jgi:hypothetical protein
LQDIALYKVYTDIMDRFAIRAETTYVYGRPVLVGRVIARSFLPPEKKPYIQVGYRFAL